MKTKKFSKKLSLNKETIADLKSNDMKFVHGGNMQPETRYGTSCPVQNCTATGVPCNAC